MEQTAEQIADLLDWKRRIFALYAAVRAARDPAEGHRLWRAARDDLFARHPQSPIPAVRRPGFGGLPFFPYDPALRFGARVEEAARHAVEIGTSGTEPMRFTRFGTVRFAIEGTPVSLDLYWLDAYGGGVFVPFRDATAGSETYGAGRYLLDTVKGADLGAEDGLLILDFNFAYNPSCSYDPRWVCPLAPPANHLAVPVRAGERYG